MKHTGNKRAEIHRPISGKRKTGERHHNTVGRQPMTRQGKRQDMIQNKHTRQRTQALEHA